MFAGILRNFKILAMTKIKYPIYNYLIMLSFIFSTSSELLSQTRGMILEPATSVNGRNVLDPNGDGYISATTSGFSSNDITESEIPFVTLIPAGEEPPGDIQNGPTCGFTDFVETVAGGLDPALHYVDDDGNWLFRLRMGGIAPNAKSYSILIDTDGLLTSATNNPKKHKNLNYSNL
jgi:hypothetical protein